MSDHRSECTECGNKYKYVRKVCDACKVKLHQEAALDLLASALSETRNNAWFVSRLRFMSEKEIKTALRDLLG